MTSELKISAQLSLPLDAVTETFAILAVKRAGKSNAAVVMAEEMYDAGVPWVAVDPKGDWWGVRAAGDGQAPGLSVLVFGGLHGDVPLEPTAGRLVADLITEQRVTCVLDVSEMTKADQRRFLTDFADRLYRRNTEPLHVFCEEADEYIPQRVLGEAAKLVGAFETLVKRGGFRGIGVTLITQRSASLNKDVLTQAGTLIAMRTPSPQDRKAVLAWIDYHAASRDVIDELPTLDAGEAWVFSPQWLSTLQKIRFRRRRTFDSGATPKVGGKPRPPARLADVDLAAIKEAMAETIERAKADDPRELRKRIAELERQLRDRPTPEPQIVEIPILDDDARALVERVAGQWDAAYDQAVDVVNTLRDALARVGAHHGRADVPRTRPAGDRPDPVERPRTTQRPDPTPRRQQSRPPVQGSTPPADIRTDVQLKKGALRMLSVLAQFHPRALTRDQLSTLAEVTRGGTFSSYLSSLNQAGYIATDPATVRLTTQGITAAGSAISEQPMTTEQLVAAYSRKLKSGARRMLDLLVAAYPNGYSRNDLSDAADVTRGGTFSSYLSSLVTNGLADATREEVKASATLFLEQAN